MERYRVLKLVSKGFFSLALITGLLAVSSAACKPGPAAVETALKDYLEKNPQYLEKKIEEVLKKKNTRPPEPSLEEKMKNPVAIDIGSAPVKGSPNASITIIEFSDFECPFCGRVVPTIGQLLKDYDGKIRIAFRQNPLPFHKNAMSAAKASLAAHAQGKFWEMHDALFAGQKDLSDNAIIGVAKKIGLNVNKFKTDWKSDKFNKQIEDDMAIAKKTGATGTPAFFINGIPLKGARPLASFKEVIDKLLETGGKPPAPVPAAAPPTAPGGAPSAETQPQG